MNQRTIHLNPTVLLCVALGLAVGPGCDSDGATATGAPVVLHFEGVVESDLLGPLQEPILLRVFGADGRGGWSEATPDATGRYTMEVTFPDGCVEGAALEAAARITPADHFTIEEDLGSGRSVQCTSAVQSLDYGLYLHVVRTPYAVNGNTQMSGLSTFERTCAVTDAGLSCWGMGDLAPEPLPGSADFRAVVVAAFHECALDSGGAAWCWGTNIHGALGIPGTQTTPIPLRVETDLRFVELAANGGSTCGRTENGELHCWGQHGGASPTLFGGELRFTQISSFAWHLCGVEEAGDVYCWGTNFRGETGDLTSSETEAPTRVEGVEGAVAVSVGWQSSCALTAGGEVTCWGWNCYGQLGNGVGAETRVPMVAAEVPPLVSISLGFGFSCGLTLDGEAWCWGLNDRGQLGVTAQTGTYSISPLRVGGEMRFESLSAGRRSTCGIGTDGRTHCWGERPEPGTTTAFGQGGAAGWEALPFPESVPELGSLCS